MVTVLKHCGCGWLLKN